jgi:SIR2-like domain
MPAGYDTNIDEPAVYDELCEVVSRGDLILFAGAGLSAQATTPDGRHPPNWKKLIQDMIEWASARALIQASTVQELRDLVDIGLLLDAAQELEELLTPSDRQQCLRETLLCDQATIGEAHQLISEIPFRAILTTNYDEFIEGAYFNKHGFMLPRFYERTHTGVLDVWRSRKPFILKVHGDVNDPHSVVMGRHSYDRLLYDYGTYIRCLESIITGSSLLFVGFGGADPNLEGILSRVSLFDGRSSKRHWMVTLGDDIPALKTKRLWLDKGIKTVRYQTNHTELARFLKNLSEHCR